MEKRIGQTGVKPEYHCASVSWGAGSLYMLLRLLEEPLLKLNMVVFVNMGAEFEATLHMRDKLLPVLAERGIVYKEIDVSEKFLHDMYKHPVKDRETGEIHRIGYSWCGGPCRWGTSLKLQALYQFYRQELSQYTIVEYIGICADEESRQYCNAQNLTIKKYPLIDWGITKEMAVMGCYRRGFFWEEKTDTPYTDTVYLYEILDNCSCFWCRNKNLKELKNICYLLPKYWDRLKALQADFPDEPMKGCGKSVFELEKRFLAEGRRMSLFDMIPPMERVIEEKKDVSRRRCC